MFLTGYDNISCDSSFYYYDDIGDNQENKHRFLYTNVTFRTLLNGKIRFWVTTPLDIFFLHVLSLL